jgi:ribosome-associated protein
LLDFGSFIVHVFTERARRFYDLERLWRAAHRMDFTDPDESRPAPGTAEAEEK